MADVIVPSYVLSGDHLACEGPAIPQSAWATMLQGQVRMHLQNAVLPNLTSVYM